MTVKQLCADARTIAGEMNFTDPNDSEMIRYADMALQKVGKLLQGVDPRVFGQVAVKNVSADAGETVQFTGATYAQATQTITKSSAFGGINAYGFVVGTMTSGVDTYFYFARIASKTSNTLVLDRDINSGGLTLSDVSGIVLSSDSTGSPSLSVSGHPISSVELLTGTVADNIRSVDIDEFFSLANNPNYDNAAAYFQKGQTIMTYAGSSLTGGLGVVFVFYKRSPARITLMTETVDLPIKYHGILRDEIAKQLLVRRGKVPPRELANPLEALEAQMAGIQKGFQLAQEKREARK